MSAPHLRHPGEDALRQEWGTIEENALRLDTATTEQLVAALNRDLSGLYILFNQLRKQYWTLSGRDIGQVLDFLEDAADRLAEMTDDLAIRVVALGGVPVNGPKGIREHAPLRIEAGDVYDLRSSLSNDLDGYATLAVQFRDHITLADELGDEGTSELLRDHVGTIEADAHDVEKFLADDSLVSDA